MTPPDDELWPPNPLLDALFNIKRPIEWERRYRKLTDDQFLDELQRLQTTADDEWKHIFVVQQLAAALMKPEATIRAKARRLARKGLAAVYWMHINNRPRLVITADPAAMEYLRRLSEASD